MAVLRCKRRLRELRNKTDQRALKIDKNNETIGHQKAGHGKHGIRIKQNKTTELNSRQVGWMTRGMVRYEVGAWEVIEDRAADEGGKKIKEGGT